MLVDVGELIWGLIGIATLVLLGALVAVAWELRNVLKTARDLAVEVERDLAPTLQDVHHILSRLDSATAVIGDKVEDTAHTLETIGESFAAGRMRAQDAWDDTRVWLDSLRVGWRTGVDVWRNGGNGGNGHYPLPRYEQTPADHYQEQLEVKAAPAD